MVRISIKFGIILLTALLLILAACGGGSDETTETVSTLTPIPTASPTIIPTHTPTPESILTPIETITPTQTPISVVTPTLMPTSSPTPTLVSTPVPTEEPTPIPTETTSPESKPMICSFNGYVAIDNATVPDDTVISAWIDGDLVASAATDASTYEMTVIGEYTGKVVSFKIDSYKATQTTIWENGADITVGLSVCLGPPVCDFYGTVIHSDGIVPDGTPISAWVDGTVVGTTTVSSSGYRLQVTGFYSGKTVSFRVGSDQATQTSIWERGGNENVDLTVVVQ